MQEHARHGTPGKLSNRIQPPDGPATANSPLAAQSPLAELRMPALDSALPRWLSVEQVRKLERMRRETVIRAMRTGDLPFERRGRICYIRLSDVIAWEQRRLQPQSVESKGLVHPSLAGLA